jgi:hypothetical protein
MRPYFRNAGGACTAFFLVVGFVSTFAAFFNIDGSFPRPKLMALVFAMSWSLFVLLGVWLLLLYYRYRLFVNDTVLRQVGVMRKQHADLSLVNELKWRRFPSGGSVRLSGSFGILKIGLGNFGSADRDRLIAFLRQAIGDANQQGWDEFRRQFDDTPEKRKRARRFRFWLAIFLIANAIAFAVAWMMGFGAMHLPMSIVNAVVGGYWLRMYIRNEEKKEASSLTGKM